MGCGKICFWIAVVVAVLAWIFKVYPWQWWVREYSLVPPVSYDGRIHFNLADEYQPDTEAKIKQIVKNAFENNKKIRVLADGHSWSEIAQTQDVMISLARYTGMVSYDTEKKEATFKAGTSLRNISLALDAVGLAMIQLGSVAGQSIAGAISTGTHGTGLTIGNLASLVTKLKIVTGNDIDGKVIELSEGDAFEAARVSIGLFGVITEVTLRVKDKYNLKEKRTHTTLVDCIDNIFTLSNSSEYEYVKLWVEFYNNFCIKFQTKVTSEEPHGNPGELLSFLTYYTFAVATRVTYLLPSLTRYFMFLVDWIGFGINTERVDNSFLILNDYFELPIHQEGEVLVEYKDSAGVLTAIRDLVLENKYPVNYITEVRFVAGDDIWLSPSYNRPDGICAITLTIYAPPSTVNDYFSAVYKATEAFGARFHWGKHFYAKRPELETLYCKLDDFAQLRKQYDPKGIFINDFLEDTFDFSED